MEGPDADVPPIDDASHRLDARPPPPPPSRDFDRDRDRDRDCDRGDDDRRDAVGLLLPVLDSSRPRPEPLSRVAAAALTRTPLALCAGLLSG